MSRSPAPASSPAPVAHTAQPVASTPPASTPPADVPGEGPAGARSDQRRPWWQWMFLYPATAAALLTAVPAWTDKFREVWHDLSGTSTTIAEALDRQDRINRNMSCLASPEIWVPAHNMSVDGTICDSGDILIRLVTHDGKKAIDIFETASLLEQVEPQRSASVAPMLGRLLSFAAEARPFDPQTRPAARGAGPVRAAPAITLAQQEYAITLCQKYVDDRMLLRHVQVGAACFNETLDTFTGVVVSREQVPCNNSCG